MTTATVTITTTARPSLPARSVKETAVKPGRPRRATSGWKANLVMAVAKGADRRRAATGSEVPWEMK